ncbi:hypothetical protein HKBW3S47_02266, partial [Candidatus Hakubella thermalkaliphila]
TKKGKRKQKVNEHVKERMVKAGGHNVYLTEKIMKKRKTRKKAERA